jgi:basic membrane protein A
MPEPLARHRRGRRPQLTLVPLLLGALLLPACGSDSDKSGGGSGASASSNANIGLILAGSKDDGSSNEEVFKEVSALSKETGGKLAVSESVAPSNAPQVLRSLAQQGYGVIGAMGAEFQKPIEQLAPQFPKTKFIVVYGAPTKVENVLGVVADPYSTSYVDGVAAGLMTKSGKIGIISGEDSQSFAELVSGIKQGVKSVNDDAEVKVVFSGDYSDAQKNKEATQTLIDGGADVFLGYLDAGAPVMARTAQSADKYVVGLVGDMSSVAPDAVITSGLLEVGKIAADAIGKALKGDFQGGRQQALGLKEGFGGVGKFGDFVPQDVREKIEKVAEDLRQGKIEVKRS